MATKEFKPKVVKQKLPRTHAEFSQALATAHAQAKSQLIYEHQQLRMATVAEQLVTHNNARQDIIRALADIGIANAKIAYSLMKSLETR